MSISLLWICWIQHIKILCMQILLFNPSDGYSYEILEMKLCIHTCLLTAIRNLVSSFVIFCLKYFIWRHRNRQIRPAPETHTQPFGLRHRSAHSLCKSSVINAENQHCTAHTSEVRWLDIIHIDRSPLNHDKEYIWIYRTVNCWKNHYLCIII